MAKQEDMSRAQREQQKLLAEAMKRPGVAAAAEAYGRVNGYALAQNTLSIRSGYATGGNAA